MKRLALWDNRSPRERRVIAVAGALLVLLLAIALVWLPLERLRTRLANELPRLRASIAALQRDADEVKRLRSMPAIASGKAAPLSALAASGARELPGAQITILDDKHVRVSGADVGYAALLDWIAAVQAAHGLRVELAHVEALPAAGRVRAELTLARSS
jgi:general secretion pathway protein M